MNFPRHRRQSATAYPTVGTSARGCGQADHDPAFLRSCLVVSVEMHPLLPRSTLVLAAVLAAGLVNSASAQNSASASTSPDLKARCDQLISYFDRYGAGRSENSDGARNHTRIAAGLDCEKGHYAE